MPRLRKEWRRQNKNPENHRQKYGDHRRAEDAVSFGFAMLRHDRCSYHSLRAIDGRLMQRGDKPPLGAPRLAMTRHRRGSRFDGAGQVEDVHHADH
jgi:hypothetical protein